MLDTPRYFTVRDPRAMVSVYDRHGTMRATRGAQMIHERVGRGQLFEFPTAHRAPLDGRVGKQDCPSLNGGCGAPYEGK